MESAQKSFELQAQVRQNAEVVKNTLNDLYNWEKEIKDKEKKIQSLAENNDKENLKTLPIRSHINEMESKKVPVTTNAAPATPLSNGINKSDILLSPSSEKQDTPKDLSDLEHKKANEIKDYGNKLVKMSDFSNAIEAYTKAIQLYDMDAVYYCNRALCYLKLERYEECIEDCENAIEIDRLAVKAYYRRMMANESLGNNMDALKDCTTVLMIEPQNGEAKRSLDRINERLRKNVRKPQGPNFTPARSDLIDILPIEKPAYKRSAKPLCRIAIADIVGPKESNGLNISDDDIDKLFNSNCGQFEEIKTPVNKEIQIKRPSNVQKPAETQGIEAQIITNVSQEVDTNKMEKNPGNKTERPLPPAPISTAQFYCNWKELTPKQKYHYLKSIPVQHICKILGAGFDSETLSDIINTLHDFYLLEKDLNAAKILLEVSKNKQVAILSLLMSADERKVLLDVINSLKETSSMDAASAEQIIKNFNLY